MTFKPDRDAPPELRQAQALEHIALVLEEWAEDRGIGMWR